MKKYKRFLAFILAFTIVTQSSVSFADKVYPSGLNIKVDEGVVTQTNSSPESVYLSNCDGKEREVNIDDNWKFLLGNTSGASEISFDDSSWRTVDLPHDYSIEQKYDPSNEAESAYLPGGTGWYRKVVQIPETAKGKRIQINFGGVYMNASVYINGKLQGTHPYGYTPFSYDITDDINFGKDNIIAVKVDHRTPSSR